MKAVLYDVIYESSISIKHPVLEHHKAFLAYTARDAVYQSKLYFKNLASKEGYEIHNFKILYVCPYGTYKVDQYMYGE